MTAIRQASVGELPAVIGHATVPCVDTTELLQVLAAAAEDVAGELRALDDWGLAGTRPGQYRSDLVADDVAVRALTKAGLGVLSEESGFSQGAEDRPLLAVLDPVDGSTNASRRIPWYATSICVLDAEGPLCALVVNQATGVRYEAVRGAGATARWRARSRPRAKSRSTAR